MNFDQSIAAHTAWKGKLKAYLRKPDKSLAAASIRKDSDCSLGQWIHGEGRKYSADPDFEELEKEHASFHKAAADLVDRADSGERVAEEAALGANSSFSKASGRVVQLLMKMKTRHSSN